MVGTRRVPSTVQIKGTGNYNMGVQASRHTAAIKQPAACHAGKRGTPHGPVLDGNEVVAKAEEDEAKEDRHHHRDAVVGSEHQRIAPRIAQGPAADLNKLQTIKRGTRGEGGQTQRPEPTIK